MAILPALGDPPPDASLTEALAVLAEGLPIGIPTDTVYGLAVDPFVPGASDRVFAAKRRPRDVDLPVLVASTEQALTLATAVPEVALALMERYWPGPLTLVVPRRPDLDADLGNDEATIALRCPAHPVPLALCRKLGPLATTSANLHGEPTSTTAGHVAEVFGDAVPVVLDGGTCTGSPSTVVDCTGVEPRLLREGRVPWSEVLTALGS
jgi:L-threonylcarbamoyladenylate synthase